MMHKLTQQVWVPVLVAAYTTAVLAGCATSQHSAQASDAASSTGSGVASPRTSASRSASVLPAPWASSQGTPAQQAAAQAALAAYQGMWSDLARLGGTSDWRNPELGRYMTGDVLSNWSSSFALNKRQGLVLLGTPVSTPRVFSVAPSDHPNTVEIADCVDMRNWLQYGASTHRLADSVPGGRHWSEAAVTFDPRWQRWLVSQQLLGKKGSC
ncbi:hypothetical protein [Streptacidiphilus neutrinimicus]|uniref:hypothetical protein n=1 Tax=Streptacidiphilus neutrinimicus TaxID=105420 RepID=UPI00126A636C|nr:hypothetical protein [Streptacidiphilus neutrinimicus]